jgi:hypothetical protein
MPPDEIDETSQPVDESLPAIVEPAPHIGVSRRTFLKAAALGTAAAALLNSDNLGKLQFGPLSALAADFSTYPCTAGDIEVSTQANILNEPCTCTTATFTALVSFSVTNTTGTDRYCVVLHLPPAGGIPGQDVILTTDPSGLPDPSSCAKDTVPAGSSNLPMYGLIQGVPCGAGQICFSSQQPDNKGKCPTANSCATISFLTSNPFNKQTGTCGCVLDANGNAPSFPHGQCRHQQICITGFSAALACGSCGSGSTSTSCNPQCGQPATLHATVTAPPVSGAGAPTNPACKSATPFVYNLYENGNYSTSFGPTSATCHDFTVTPTTTTMYTATICDERLSASCATNTCCRTAPTTITITPNGVNTPSVQVSGGPDCTGLTTLSSSVCDAGVTYTFLDGSTVLGTVTGGGASCSLTTDLSLGTTHSISIVASNGVTACNVQSHASTITVNAAVTPNLTASTPGCDGTVGFTTAPTGGDTSSAYTYTWKVDGVTQTATGNNFTYNPCTLGNLDGTCHSVSVTVTDSSKCSGTETLYLSQCVTTTGPRSGGCT